MSEGQILELARAILTPKEFETWELYYRAGWSYGKIATALDIDRSTIQRRVQRAQSKLHKRLAEEAA